MRSQSGVKKEESCFHSQAISIPTSLAPLFEGDKKERGEGSPWRDLNPVPHKKISTSFEV